MRLTLREDRVVDGLRRDCRFAHDSPVSLRSECEAEEEKGAKAQPGECGARRCKQRENTAQPAAASLTHTSWLDN